MNFKKIVTSTVLLTLTCGFFCLSAEGITINVPADSATIQSAIDGANPGDVIVLTQGTYGDRDIDFKGKAITVRSTNPNDPNIVAATVIDCQGSPIKHRGFHFHSGEGRETVLAGVTIINGYQTSGGGIYCDNASSPTISNCIIDGNSADIYGAGIYCNNGSNPLITNCIISNNNNNFSGGFGGGISCKNSSPVISHCTFSKNSAYYGGGMFMYNGSNPVISNCTFSKNTAINQGGGIYAKTNCAVTITNSVLWGDNVTPTDNATIPDLNGPEIGVIDNSGVTITYSDVQGGEGLIYVSSSSKTWGVGNIETDPKFISITDLHLTGISPCINTGDPNGVYDNQTDIDGDPRVIQVRVDMGSDEMLFGTLSADTTPVKGAIVVDGQTLGTAPQSRDLPVGTYTVSFGAMTGYTQPADQQITISKNETTVVLGTYAQQTGTLTVSTTPVSGEVIVDGVSWGTSPQSRNIAVGSHTVSFGAVSGYTSPQGQTPTVQAGQTTTVPGTYLRNSPTQVHLTVNVTGQGTVLPQSGDFDLDSVVSLTAVLDADGWTFDHWEGDVTGSDAQVNLTMDGNKTVTAVFLASDNQTTDDNTTNPCAAVVGALCPCFGMLTLAGLFAGVCLLGRNY
ncbi:MAG: right-handed parallel beta-helix repeat-containing protein [Phycisphaerae bacterium]